MDWLNTARTRLCPQRPHRRCLHIHLPANACPPAVACPLLALLPTVWFGDRTLQQHCSLLLKCACRWGRHGCQRSLRCLPSLRWLQPCSLTSSALPWHAAVQMTSQLGSVPRHSTHSQPHRQPSAPEPAIRRRPPTSIPLPSPPHRRFGGAATWDQQAASAQAETECLAGPPCSVSFGWYQKCRHGDPLMPP